MKPPSRPEGRPPMFFRDAWIALLVGLMVMLAFALFSYGKNRFRAYEEQQRRAELTEKVSMARHALEPILAELRAGKISQAAAIEAARERLRTLCFEDESGPNYIFITGMDGRVILRPFRTQDEGAMDANIPGGGLLKEVIPGLRVHPEGIFYAYPFPSPKMRHVEDKLSYFQLVPELDVMIGTGAYLNEESRALLAVLRSGFFIFLTLLLLFLAPIVLAMGSLRAQNLKLAREIRERLHAEVALRRSESTLKAVFDSAPIGIASMKDRRFIEVNETFARIFQRDRAEFPGQSIRMTYAREEDSEAAGLLYGLPHGITAQETQGQRADGSMVPLVVRLAPLELEGAESEYVTITLDITQQKEAQAALHASEAMLKLVLNTIPQAVFWKDCAGTYLGCNEAFAHFAGREDSAEIIGRTDFDMPWGSEHAETYLADDRVVMESRQPKRHIIESLRDAKEREFWLDTTKVPLEDHQGKVIGSLGVFEDITDRKRVEDDLAQSRLFTDAVMDSIPGILYVYDLDGRMVRWNKRNEELTGYSTQELKGFPILDWFKGDSEETQRILEAFQRARREGQTEAEAHLRMKDGRRIPYYFTAVSVDIGGKPYIVGVGLDMTEQKKAEAETHQNQQRFRAIFDANPMSITLADPETGVYVDVNPRFCEVLDRPKEEILGKTPEQLGLVLEESGLQRAMQILDGGGSVSAMDIKIHIPGKGERDVLATIRRVPVESRPLLLFMAMDITEWKRSEQIIQESERRLSTLFEGSPIGIFRSTPEGRFLQVNPALAAMFRYEDPLSTVQQVNAQGIGQGLYESPDQRLDLVRRLQDNVGTWFVEEVHFRRKDGTFMDGIMSISLHPDPETEQPLLFGFVQDISERKKAEDSLKAKTALLSAQANATLDGILVVSMQQKRILSNRALLDMFKVPREVMENEDDTMFLEQVVGLTRNPKAFLEKVIYLYAHPTETSRDEIEFRNGTVLERYSAPVLGENGELYGRIWTFHDITERKKVEQEILHLKNYLSNVIDSMPSALVGLNCQKRVTQWNRAAETLLGIPEAEALGRPIEDLAPDFAPWISVLCQEIQREHRPASMEKLLLEREGERHFFELMMYPLVTDGMEGAVVRIQDITERVRIQELMIQTEKMMSVGGLAAGMAHEINNPLGIISQATQNIERRLSTELPANRVVAEEIGLDMGLLQAYFEKRQITQFMGGIREAVGRATKIVGNMLQFSRQADSARHAVSLPAILEQALELAANDYDLKKKYDFRSIEIQREFEQELPLVPVVAIEIEQVFLNLLKNAAQAMAGNPPSKHPCLILRARREAKHVVLEIEDNGPGMDETIRRRVFEPFFTTKDPGVGTGLGLSVSYTIITQNHKGLLEVASTPGVGTCFTLRLPVMREREDA